MSFALLIVGIAYLALIYVCFQKGKDTFAWLGIVGLIPFLTPILGWFPAIGALRLAKPDSSWAHEHYGPEMMAEARRRFPDVSSQTGTRILIADRRWEYRDRVDITTEAAVTRPEESPPSVDPADQELASFLTGAVTAGVLDEEVRIELLDYAARRHEKEVGVVPPREPSLPSPDDFSPYAELADVEPSPKTPAQRPAPDVRTPAANFASPWTERLEAMGEAVKSDLVLHGFNYLGVLIVFVAVLGFLLFSFVEIPDAQQPLYELAMALIFFGFAWYLRRQGATFVAKGMELTGGMVLPLVVFAGLVDNAPFPPDFRDGQLVVVLTVTALAMSAAYAWIALRWPSSMLRFLVMPLVWLAAMTAGFVFKTDERLFSDAITRLVSWQPALASAAIAASLLVFMRRWRDHPLGAATFNAALAGIPVAYMLTISLGVGERWTSSAPAVVLGAATFVSVELVAHKFGQTTRMAALRPLLLAGVIIPLAPGLGTSVAGLITTLGYALILELTAIRNPDQPITLSLCAVGLAIGAVAALGEPWPAVLASAVVTSWTHYRRGRPGPFAHYQDALTLVAALAPVGIASGIVRILPGEPGWLIMAVTLTAVALVVRIQEVNDRFWDYWLPGASVLVTLGAYNAWLTGETPWAGLLAVFIVSAVVAFGRRWPEIRVWLTLAAFSTGFGMTLDTVGATSGERITSWATLGLLFVAAAAVWRHRPAGHLALAGHLMAGAASVAAFDQAGFDQATFTTATGLWTVGWLITVVVSERGGEAATSVLARFTEEPSGARQPADWVAPVVVAGSVPVTVLAWLGLWPEFAAHYSWTGITLSVMALVYVSVALQDRLSRPLVVTLATVGVLMSLGAVYPALTDRVPALLVSSAVIATAALAFRSLRWRSLTWIAWADSFLLMILLADSAGIGADRLHLIVLGWGALLLSGGLWLDDRLRGRRTHGEMVRVWWLRAPAGLGAIAVPLALAPVYFEPPEVYGWWSLAAAVFSLLVALQIRIGAVTYLTYTLGSLGLVVLSPWDVLDQPWRLVALAAPLVLISFLVERRQGVTDPWIRWDIAPLVVAHIVGAIALTLAVPADDLLYTALVFGGLSVLVGLWKRRRVWMDVGNLLILLPAAEAGPGWLTVALAATAVRGALGAYVATGDERLVNHVIGVAAGGLAWLSFLDLQPWGLVDELNLSSLVWGGLTLVVSALRRRSLVRDDTVWFWGGLGAVAVGLAVMAMIVSGQLEASGPYMASAVLMVSAACELGWMSVDPLLRHAAIPGAGLAWLLAGAGLAWEPSLAAPLTALAFGTVMMAVSESARLSPPERDETLGLNVARSWAALAAIGVVAAIGMYAVTLAPGDEGYLVALGTGVLAAGTARGARPLRLDWLRDVSGVVMLGSVTLIAVAAEISESAFALTLVVGATVATFASLSVWTRHPASVTLRPLMVLGAAATIEALGYAVAALPKQTVFIAVLLSAGVQALGIGLHQDRTGFLAAGPPLIGAAVILTIAVSPATSPQWYTAVVGLVVLSELDILRKVRSSRGKEGDMATLLLLEWSGLALIALPGLVEMFRSGLSFALVSFLVAAGVFMWAIVTRVKRRAISAAALALATAVLGIFAAAASTAPESASLWIVGAGFGSAVMLVAGLVEAYLSRKGHLMVRIGQLMEGWE